jgi:hypothetical protein
MHINLIIATPGHSMMADYVKCLLATTEELNKRNISWAFSTAYSSMVSDAREMTISGTNKNSLSERLPFEGKLTYDKIMWIDSDIAWNPQDVIDLYESDKDIISGAYLLASGEVMAYPKILYPALTFEQVKEMKELQKIEAAGFGFICIKSGVFESMTRPWFQSSLITMQDEETKENHTFPIMGEDISWCHRAGKEGFEIWLNPAIKVTHHKTMKLTWEGIKI